MPKLTLVLLRSLGEGKPAEIDRASFSKVGEIVRTHETNSDGLRGWKYKVGHGPTLFGSLGVAGIKPGDIRAYGKLIAAETIVNLAVVLLAPRVVLGIDSWAICRSAFIQTSALRGDILAISAADGTYVHSITNDLAGQAGIQKAGAIRLQNRLHAGLRAGRRQHRRLLPCPCAAPRSRFETARFQCRW